MKERRRGLALLLSVTLLATACAGNGGGGQQSAPPDQEVEPRGVLDRPDPEELADEQTLNVFAFFKPPSFDPARQGPATFGGNGLRRQYTEALLRPEAELSNPDVTGAAAEGYDVSEDGRVYTFRIRPEAKYNDGKPVAAADFVYAWRRLIDPRVPSPVGRIFARIVEGGSEAASLGPDTAAGEIDSALDELGLQAIDERTFEVTLSDPAPYFKWIATLTAGAPVRRDVIEQHGAEAWATKPETLVTNGPFMVSEIGENETTLVRNPHYWDDPKPHLERIVAGYGLDPAPRWTKYLNDELDVSNGPPPASYEAALADPRFDEEILRYPELSVQWLGFNTQTPPFDNPKVRLAFAKAIDREAYDRLAADTGEPIASLVPQGLAGHDPDLDTQAFEPTEAKAVLEDSGVDMAQLEGLQLLTAPPQESNALFIKDQLQKHLGVTVNVESIGDSASLSTRVKQGDYDMRQTFIGHAANYPDPQDFFDVFLSTSPDNEPGWTNADYDRLVREADTTTDMEERLKLYDQAHEILVREAPVAFLVQLERIFWVKPWVRGIKRTPVDTAFLPGDLYTKDITIAAH